MYYYGYNGGYNGMNTPYNPCYNTGYDSAFSFDDDLLGITYTISGLTGNGDPKSKCIKNPNVSKVLAMWQLSMEKAVKEKNVLISGVMPMGFSWKSEYCQSDHSMLWYRGLPSQAVCLNIKGLVEAGFRSSSRNPSSPRSKNSC